ncbi:MAG: NAD kinase [Bacteroidia bacterium]|nr:NAD kinase [Bacteroidia bacterium]
MRFALYGNTYTTKLKPFVQALVNKLHASKSTLVIHHTYYDLLQHDIYFETPPQLFSSANTLSTMADVLISVGGDGTMLSTIKYVQNTDMPVIGLNAGRLGFLANIAKDEIDVAIDALLNNEYTIETRSLLRLNTTLNLFDGFTYALNECTIHKRDSAAMITIHAYLNNEFLNSYWADGLIIATPTGSTAYSLSCGGPIVTPDCANFIITPIAPHNLNVRPLIIPDNKTLKLKVEGRQNNYLVTLDSRSQTINSDFEIILTKDQYSFKTIKLNNQTFFNTLRNKLLWGIDKRN